MPDLNPNQFGEAPRRDERGFYRKGFNLWGGKDSTQYEYKIPTGSDDEYGAAHLVMQVDHHRNSADYSYRRVTGDSNAHADELAEDDEYRRQRGYWSMPPARRDAVEAYVKGEPKLFGSDETPGRSEVYSLFTTKQGRTHAPTALGIAARDTAMRYGRTLQPPADLSPHSARLVKNLKGKGVVARDAPDEVVNSYDFYEAPEWSSLGPEDRIPESEVKAGRSMLRATLRGDRPRKQRETYVQERLL